MLNGIASSLRALSVGQAWRDLPSVLVDSFTRTDLPGGVAAAFVCTPPAQGQAVAASAEIGHRYLAALAPFCANNVALGLPPGLDLKRIAATGHYLGQTIEVWISDASGVCDSCMLSAIISLNYEEKAIQAVEHDRNFRIATALAGAAVSFFGACYTGRILWLRRQERQRLHADDLERQKAEMKKA